MTKYLLQIFDKDIREDSVRWFLSSTWQRLGALYQVHLDGSCMKLENPRRHDSRVWCLSAFLRGLSISLHPVSALNSLAQASFHHGRLHHQIVRNRSSQATWKLGTLSKLVTIPGHVQRERCGLYPLMRREAGMCIQEREKSSLAIFRIYYMV